jgi:hypothetical protein
MRKVAVRFAITLALIAAPLPALAESIQAVLYKNPQCSCCESYAAYLNQNGFQVEVKSTNDLTEISAKAGVPADLEGCHTMFIEGYVVDGLVPVDVIQKLLKERPAIAGITLPGMPMGAPGMAGSKSGPFTIYAISKTGAAPTVYAVE